MPVGRKSGGGVPYGGRSKCRCCWGTFYSRELNGGMLCKDCRGFEHKDPCYAKAGPDMPHQTAWGTMEI